MQSTTTYITLGGGCFWCLEAVFQNLNGVVSVQSGYSGGLVINPSYKEVYKGITGHAEVIQLGFDPTVVTIQEILDVFWRVHDPTTINKQGNDVGTQYRSVIYCDTEAQYNIAVISKQALEESMLYDNPVVTEIELIKNFYSSEAYHDNYFKNNPNQSYCQYVVGPKVSKFKALFAEKLKISNS